MVSYVSLLMVCDARSGKCLLAYSDQLQVLVVPGPSAEPGSSSIIGSAVEIEYHYTGVHADDQTHCSGSSAARHSGTHVPQPLAEPSS